MALNPQTIAAGKLRRKVSFQTSSPSRDTLGEPLTIWATQLITRGDVEALKETERYAVGGGHFAEQVTHRITIRYHAGIPIVSGMRATCNGKDYLVQMVDNVEERNRLLKVYCLDLQDQRPLP